MYIFHKQPLYSQVAEKIVREMLNGPPLKCLPSEEQLSKQMGTSKNTIREALAELQTQGIIQKIHGVGNVIMYSTLQLQFRIDIHLDFVEIIEKAGYAPSISHTLSHYTTVDASLPIPRGDYFTYTEHILADDRVACQSFLYVPKANIIWPECPPDLKKPDMFDFIHQLTGQTIAHSIVRFVASETNVKSANAFGIESATPIFTMLETFHSIQDNAICYVKLYFNPELFKPTMVRKGFFHIRQTHNLNCSLLDE